MMGSSSTNASKGLYSFVQKFIIIKEEINV